MSQIKGESRHLRLVGVADKKSRRADQHGHRQQHRIVAHHVHGRPNVFETPNSRRSRRGRTIRTVGRLDQPYEHRDIDERIDEYSVHWAHYQQQQATNCGAHQKRQVTPGRIEAHRARHQFRPDNAVNQHLRSGHPNDAGQAVNHQQHHCLPLLCRVGREHHTPSNGYAHKQQHSNLNQATDIEPISQRTRVGGKKEIWGPMRDDREGPERGGVKFLKNHPVRNHVLDVVGHHRRAAREKVDPKISICEGGKCGAPRCSLWRSVDLRFQFLQCPQLWRTTLTRGFHACTSVACGMHSVPAIALL